MALVNYDELKSNCRDATGLLETSDVYPDFYQQVTGNFDGAGLSWGVFQWNFGSTTLQPIFEDLIDNYPIVVQTAFDYTTDPTDYNTFVDVVKNQTLLQQVAWGDSISVLPSKRVIMEPWNTYLFDLAGTQEAQDRMDIATEPFHIGALGFFNSLKDETPVTYGSRRMYSFCFDYWIQYGGHGVPSKLPDILAEINNINTIDLTDEEIEVEKMLIASRIRASISGDATWQDAKARKDMFAIGKGLVHGFNFNLEKNYNLTMEYAFPSTPATAPRATSKLRDDKVEAGNWRFDLQPTIRDERMLTNADRLDKKNISIDGIWQIKNGMVVNNMFVKSGGASGTVYKRLIRIKHKANFGRAIIVAELVHTGTNVKLGQIQLLSYNNPDQTINATSRWRVVTYGLGVSDFIAGDIQYQQYKNSGSYSYIDIWATIGDFAQLSLNVLSVHAEGSTEVIINPEIKSGEDSETSIPIATSTDWFDGDLFTAEDAVNFDIITITTI